MFEEPFTRPTNGHETTDSDTTSVGSIIDLVGNLSSCSSPQMSESRVSMNSNHNNNSVEALEVLPGDRMAENEDVYAQVDRRVIEKKRAQKEKKRTEKQAEYVEPVYAAVKKTKKKTKGAKSKKAGSKNEEQAPGKINNVSPLTEEPTAKSSRIFWQKMGTKGSPSDEPTPEALIGVKSRLTPTSVNDAHTPHVWDRSNSIEKVPGSSKNHFVVKPTKRGSASSRSSQGSYQSDYSAKSSHKEKSPMYLDLTPNTPPRKGDSKRTPDNDSDADSGCLVDPCMTAIPRHTVLANGPNGPNKPFVITPAKKSVISFS